MRETESYELYIYDVSYFSGKMQAYLRYKGVPHTTHEVQWQQLAFELVEEAGVMEVPLLRRPDGALMRDSTSMILWLEERFGAGPLLPADPALAFLMGLIEDYADEGLWRPALYYRWAFATDAVLNAHRFMADFLRLPGVVGPLRHLQRTYTIVRQRRTYLAEEGVTPANRGAVQQHYLDELRDLETLLAERPFLFGERPCLVDFGYFASMFRHFSIDPTPAKIMRNQAPAVYAWVARLWACRVAEVAERELLDWDAVVSHPATGRILTRIGRIYLPCLHANARAVDAGASCFAAELDGHRYPAMTAIPFRAWSRRVLIDAYQSLRPTDRTRVGALLEAHGCLQPLLADPELATHYPEGERLPECRPRTLSTLRKFALLLSGTPHHREAGKPRHL